MPDDKLNDALDSWSNTERLANRPFPPEVAQRLYSIRFVHRAMLVGAGAAVALALLALGGGQRAQPTSPAPPPPADPALINEGAPAPTIGEIYSLNNGLQNEEGEIELPAQPALDWANEDPLPPE